MRSHAVSVVSLGHGVAIARWKCDGWLAMMDDQEVDVIGFVGRCKASWESHENSTANSNLNICL